LSFDLDAVRREQAELEARRGPWTAHNIRLGDGLATLSEEPTGDEVKLRRVTQIVSDLFAGEIAGLRILDLACLEGMYAIELARRGAEVVAIEGREANLEKARFAARVLGLDGIDFQLGDVRDLSRERHGDFDVVLCLGILYHLDADDLFPFVERLYEVTRRALVVDTGISIGADETRVWNGREYRGETQFEHAPESTQEERLQAVWSSLDNPSAWAVTRPSLLRLLAQTGFTSAYECWVPAEPGKTEDRITVVALKGNAVGELVSPTPATDAAAVPERPPLGARLPRTRLWAAARRATPRPLRARIRRLVGAEIRRH
jgi:SAM-dependent methyltransferase